MRRAPRRWAVIAIVAGALAGCPAEPGRAPVVRFEVTPRYVPLGDDYTTVVTLDGSGSTNGVDAPAGAQPLVFTWALDDPAPQVVAGSLHDALVQVKLLGDRPTAVTLTVRDRDGRTAVRPGAVGVTVGGADGGAGPSDGPPDDGAAAD